jgi:hypothetical protein
MAFRVAGVNSLEARWLLHAVETTAELHYPAGAPKGIAEPLERLRKATEDAAYYSDLLAALLWHEGAEGVDQIQHAHQQPTDDASESDDDER